MAFKFGAHKVIVASLAAKKSYKLVYKWNNTDGDKVLKGKLLERVLDTVTSF